MAEPAWRSFTKEQQRAAFLVDMPVLAAAGAGAGKTAVMAVRYVAALLTSDGEQRLGPERLLAMTFTREAAGNLRVRIERTLRQALKYGRFPRPVADVGLEETDLAPADLDHLRRCLASLPAAPIATFDAVCLTWVAEHAASLGRDPELRPPEDLAWAQVEEQAWRELCAEQLAQAASDLLTLIEAYGHAATQRAVERLARQASALPQATLSGLPGDAIELARERRAGLIEALIDGLADAQRLQAKAKILETLRVLPSAPAGGGQGLTAWLASFGDLSLSGVRDDGVKEAVRLLQDCLDAPNQRRGDTRPERDKRLRCASLGALALHDPGLEAQLEARAAACARLAQDWLARRDAAARRAQLAGFSAVEAEALRLLDDVAVRRRLGRRYRHILLDEAQDLNRLQGRIVERLQEGGADTGSARIFVVGDQRQSIYGFRHADPEIFVGWERGIGERSGTTADLPHNFRSHPELLAAVCGIFAQDGLVGSFAPETIRAGRSAADFEDRHGTLQGWNVAARRDGQRLELRPTATDASEAQARQVATLVAESLARHRHRSPQDHAILLRGRSRMRLYAQALERVGIPYDTDFPGGLYDSQECHDIEAVLRLCVNPHDRRALAIALGGPWGGGDAQDRTLMVQALELPPAEGWALAKTRAPLGDLVEKLGPVLAHEGVAAAIRRLIADPLLARRYSRLPLARRRLANLARLADEEQGAGVALDAPAFIARLAERRRLGVDGEEAGGEHLGGRGVRLMTIHQAKGLEWPVVLLPDAQRKFDRRDLSAPALAQVGEDALEVACHPGDEDGDEALGTKAGLIADGLRLRLQAEEARLFYVACTRARENLHVLMPDAEPAGPVADGSVECYADWLQAARLEWNTVEVDLDRTPARIPVAIATAGHELPGLAACARPEQELVTVSERLAELSPAVAAHAGSSLSRTTAQALGVAIHAALATHEPGMARAQAEAVLAPFTAELGEERHRRLLTHLTDRNLVPGYGSAAVCLREQPVIGERDGALVFGVCDLLLKDAAGEWRLYDYKSGDAATQASSHEQLRLYAGLVRGHLDGPLVAAAIVDVEAGRLVPVDLG